MLELHVSHSYCESSYFFVAQMSGFGQNKKMPISVFVEMILNPENLNLERLTPVIFKVRTDFSERLYRCCYAAVMRSSRKRGSSYGAA